MMYSIFAFVFGAMVGSFANVCIYRLPRDLSVVFPGSRCGHCGSPVAWYDNIPIGSYLWLFGRCRRCASSFGLQYPLVEMATALLALWTYQTHGFSFSSLYLFLFITALLIVSLIDLEFRIIPNPISIGGTWLGLALAILSSWLGLEWWVTWKEAVIGALAGGGILWGVGTLYEKITGREGIGFGDVKLLALFGAHTGITGVLTSLFYGSLLGSLVGLSLMFFQGKGSRYPIPFGPFLCLGLAIFGLFGSAAFEVPLRLLHIIGL